LRPPADRLLTDVVAGQERVPASRQARRAPPASGCILRFQTNPNRAEPTSRGGRQAAPGNTPDRRTDCLSSVRSGTTRQDGNYFLSSSITLAFAASFLMRSITAWTSAFLSYPLPEIASSMPSPSLSRKRYSPPRSLYTSKTAPAAGAFSLSLSFLSW